jgi:hypothetical protein
MPQVTEQKRFGFAYDGAGKMVSFTCPCCGSVFGRGDVVAPGSCCSRSYAAAWSFRRPGSGLGERPEEPHVPAG